MNQNGFNLKSEFQRLFRTLNDGPVLSAWLTPVALLILLGVIAYFPGLSGPFMFDDLGNIIKNDFIRLNQLDQDSLFRSAHSIEAGPLGRPIANLSFALNYYIAGGFNSTHFKVTNLAIHLLNGILVYWFLSLVFIRFHLIGHTPENKSTNTGWFKPVALVVALVWLVQPIQLTSVLYVVQRMASLSAFFVLVALIIYLRSRISFAQGNRNAIAIMLLGPLVFGGLGLLSKENAALLPLFILLIEFTLFPNEMPWQYWNNFSPRFRWLISLLGIAAFIVIISVLTAKYLVPGYGGRNFTLTERILTEPRVLLFYISLIGIPRLNAFGLHHDDIAISESLLNPWTTLASIAALLTLIAIAVRFRKKWPIVSLGILWFFTGHLMESTVIPLEIAHEHRNYLASVGIILAMVYVVSSGVPRFYGNRAKWFLLCVLIGVNATITFARSNQWANDRTLHAFESLHHPDSARTALELAGMLTKYGEYEAAQKSLKHAASLEPYEASHLMWQQYLNVKRGLEPDARLDTEIIGRLSNWRLSPTAIKSFGDLAACPQNSCDKMLKSYQKWIFAVLNGHRYQTDKSYFFYLLGITYIADNQPNEAVKAFLISHQTDRQFLHPLFKLASLYIQAKQIEDAESVLKLLVTANRASAHPRDRQIDALKQEIQRLKNRK